MGEFLSEVVNRYILQTNLDIHMRICEYIK